MKIICYLWLVVLLCPSVAWSQNPGVAAVPWETLNAGLPSANIWTLAINNDGVLFAGTEDGVFRSLNDGDTWESMSVGLADSNVVSLAADSLGNLYAAVQGNGIFRSGDNADSWEAVTNNLGTMEVGDVITDALGTVYVRGFLAGVFRSGDEGASWEEVDDAGLDNPFTPSLVLNEQGTLFTGTDNGVHRSLDGGDTWEVVNTGLENLFIESLTVGRDDVLFAGTNGGVFRTFDEGESWEAVHDSVLADRTIRALASNELFVMYAGTLESGVFRSLDLGNTWEALNDGLTSLDVSSLVVADNGALLAGTIGGGLFRRDAVTDVSTDTEPSVPSAFALAGNYPNPFNPTTLIRYSVPEAAAINISVFDATGRLIAVLVDANQAAGQYEVMFDALSLPSGVYYYRMDAGTFSEVRKMVLLR